MVRIHEQQTLRQFEWKFYMNAWSGTYEAGIGAGPTQEGLRRLGLDREWELGPGVIIRVPATPCLTLPTGTLIADTRRSNPKDIGFTLFKQRGRSWQHTLGVNSLGHDAVIMEYPGRTDPPEWWVENGTPDSAKEIAEFKAEAWRVCADIKAQQGWCTTFEAMMARVGVSAKCLDKVPGAVRPGDTVSHRTVTALPHHSLLAYRSDQWPDHWAIYVRDDSCSNLTRTRRIAGHRNPGAPPLGNYQSSMVLIGEPYRGDATRWNVPSDRSAIVVGLLPIGTAFTFSGVRYVVAQDGQIAPPPGSGGTHQGIPHRGVHPPSAFSGYSVTIESFQQQEVSA
jgi:hypothetical protein